MTPRAPGGHTETARATATAPHRWATLEQAADYWQCSTRHIRDEIARGAITGYRMGAKAVRVDLAELDAALTVIPTGGRQAAHRAAAARGAA